VPFHFSIALQNGKSLDFEMQAGQTIFVLGANGTGKSSLLYRLYSQNRQNSRRISAHRQTWFESNAMQISARQKRETQSNVLAYDNDPASRWRDGYSGARANLAVFDLLDAENVRARRITSAVDNEDFALAKRLSKTDAPIKIINELLKLSALPIEITVEKSEELFASKLGGPRYSIAELSDGERNALLIAAEVLTAEPGTLFMIDEPERHLHRSIISPLLTLLFQTRSDCAFVISTHDVLLPLDNPESRTLLIRSCIYAGPNVSSWDADLVVTPYQIDDALKKDILGARRKLLFVEGDEHSLDKPIYSLLFPEASVIAKQSCRDVEHAVSGIRDADELHWLKAFGIVDGDNRDATEIAKLNGRGVYAVPAVSIESIYYHPVVQERVCERQVKVTGGNVASHLDEAKTKALVAMSSHAQRLSERAVEAAVRSDLMGKLPRRSDIVTAAPIVINIDIATIVAQEKARFEAAVASRDLLALVSRYPVRETPALDLIAKALGFQSRAQYESAVRQLLIEDKSALAFIQNLYGTLAADIAAA
jgi:ABC-type cobalamin/Fe3+-siderophores transport system ATPase subunit